MRGPICIPAFAILLFSSAIANADPVAVHPEGCDFQITFPAPPNQSQSKATTDRGDAVITDKADLRVELDGKTNFFRIECTKVAHMGFVDEAILTDNMNNLAESYKLQGASVSIDRNKVTGPVGKIHAQAKVGGKDITLEIYRYTSPNDILDVWAGAEPDAFPSGADTAFLKSITLNGTAIQ